MSKNTNTGTDNTGENNSGYRNSGDWNSGNWNSGDWNSGHRNSGHRNSGHRNSGYRNSGHRNSGHGNSGNWNSGYRNSGHRNSGYGNSGHGNSGNWNSGNWNSGDWNSGAFNTDEPHARLFNKESTVKMSDLLSSDAWPSWDGFSPCVWIESSMMTDEEKKTNPTHETTGGYIKTLAYKDAWSVFWRKTSDENKKKFLALPNFDAKIFEEITGIDVGQSEAKKKAQELREKADELLAQAKELEASL